MLLSILNAEQYDPVDHLRRKCIRGVAALAIGGGIFGIYRAIKSPASSFSFTEESEQPQLPAMEPNHGANYADMPDDVRRKLRYAIKAIQKNVNCENWVNGILDDYAKGRRTSPRTKVAVGTTLKSLLQKAQFNFYNPNNREWANLNSASVANFGGWDRYLSQRDSLNSWFRPTATTVNKNQIYLTSGFIDNRINPGRLVLHELLHVAGICSYPRPILFGLLTIWVDPLNELDDEIRKNCPTTGEY